MTEPITEDNDLTMNDSATQVLEKLSRRIDSEYWKIVDTYPLPFFRIEIHDRDPKRGELIQKRILEGQKALEELPKLKEQVEHFKDSYHVVFESSMREHKEFEKFIQENQKLKAENDQYEKIIKHDNIEYGLLQQQSKQNQEIVDRLKERLAIERQYWKGKIISELEQELQLILKGDTS